jgi:hypothetical protein
MDTFSIRNSFQLSQGTEQNGRYYGSRVDIEEMLDKVGRKCSCKETSSRSKRMELKFRITGEDFWQFHKFYFERQRYFRRTAVIFSAAAALTALLLGLNGRLPWWGVPAMVVVAAALGPLYGGFSRWRCKRSIMRLVSKANCNSGEQSLRIDAEGVFVKTQNIEGITRRGVENSFK